MSNLSKQAMAKVIQQRAHGRKIVFRGEDKELEETLKKDYHLPVEFFVTAIREKVDNVRTFYLTAIKNQVDQYFVVLPTLAYNESEKKLMKSMGYESNKDFLYAKHDPIVVNTKDMEHYEDEYGNRIICGGAAITVTFLGWGGYVEIGKNCTAPKLFIEVKDDATFKVGGNCIFRGDNRVHVHSKASICIEDNCTFTCIQFNVFLGSGIHIHEESTFAKDFIIRTGVNAKIVIGRDCMFSWNNTILGSDGHAIFDVTTGKRTNWEESAPLVIEDHVWIGAGCTILPKVKIGSGSIIGAASVVTKSVPNNCIAVGSPAKVIRKNIAWSRNVLEQDIDKCPPEYVRLTEEDI